MNTGMLLGVFLLAPVAIAYALARAHIREQARAVPKAILTRRRPGLR
jgi:multisubunit Na+/H+ antiporter MnhG subunit